MPVGWSVPKKRGLTKVDALIAELVDEKDKIITTAGKISMGLAGGSVTGLKDEFKLINEKLALLKTVRTAILADTDDVW